MSQSKPSANGIEAPKPTPADKAVTAAATDEDSSAVTGGNDEHVGVIDVTLLENPVEVAARSADQTKPSSDHVKVFVLGPNAGHNESNPYTVELGYDHEPNKAATRQYAIDQGMWPTGEVEHVSTKRHADGRSWVLTYTVPVIPAHDVLIESPNPEVIADDTDKGGATKAQNADPSASGADGQTPDLTHTA